MVVMSSSPRHLAKSAEILKDTTDKIWQLSGDSSFDFNWYTKRLLLAPVYAASEIYMTTDSSLECHDTRKFLQRRLDTSMLIGYRAGQVPQSDMLAN